LVPVKCRPGSSGTGGFWQIPNGGGGLLVDFQRRGDFVVTESAEEAEFEDSRAQRIRGLKCVERFADFRRPVVRGERTDPMANCVLSESPAK
jgi:hypothetical protein